MKRRHFIGAAAATGIAIHGRAGAQSTTNLRIAHVLSPPSRPTRPACVSPSASTRAARAA